MADGAKGAVATVVEEVPHAVVKPVADQFGKALEEGYNAVMGITPKPTDPAEEAKKKQEDSRKIANIRQFLDALAANDRASRIQAQQKKQQEEQAKLQETHQKKQKVEFEQQKKSESIAVQQAKVKTEAKPGQGAGG